MSPQGTRHARCVLRPSKEEMPLISHQPPMYCTRMSTCRVAIIRKQTRRQERKQTSQEYRVVPRDRNRSRLHLGCNTGSTCDTNREIETTGFDPASSRRPSIHRSPAPPLTASSLPTTNLHRPSSCLTPGRSLWNAYRFTGISAVHTWHWLGSILARDRDSDP